MHNILNIFKRIDGGQTVAETEILNSLQLCWNVLNRCVKRLHVLGLHDI